MTDYPTLLSNYFSRNRSQEWPWGTSSHESLWPGAFFLFPGEELCKTKSKQYKSDVNIRGVKAHFSFPFLLIYQGTKLSGNSLITTLNHCWCSHLFVVRCAISSYLWPPPTVIQTQPSVKWKSHWFTSEWIFNQLDQVTWHHISPDKRVNTTLFWLSVVLFSDII